MKNFSFLCFNALRVRPRHCVCGRDLHADVDCVMLNAETVYSNVFMAIE